MYDFKIKLADRVIAVSANYSSTADFCKDYLASDNESADFCVKISDGDIKAEREKSYAEDDFEGKQRREFSDNYLETLALYRKIADAVADFDTILFHGSVISVDGESYLFTAKSGTGKSTHTRLWRELLGNKAVMVNDDKPLIAVSLGGEVTVYGTPWCGKHGLGENMTSHLKAVCILERAADNSIVKISIPEAYPMLIQQTYRSSSPEKLIKILPILDRVLKNVSVYRLRCNMELDAAKLSYSVMSGNNV